MKRERDKKNEKASGSMKMMRSRYFLHDSPIQRQDGAPNLPLPDAHRASLKFNYLEHLPSTAFLGFGAGFKVGLGGCGST